MKVALLLATGFEEIECITIWDILRRAEIEVDGISVEDKELVEGGHGIFVKSDKKISEINPEDYDMVVLPGGAVGTENLKKNDKVIELLKYFEQKKKPIGAICAAPTVLAKAGVVKNKVVTAYPGFEEVFKDSVYVKDIVAESENILTSRGPATAMEFALKIVEKLLSKEKADDLAAKLLYERKNK